MLDRVTIGGSDLTGTGSVVTTDVSVYAILVGIPAKLVHDIREQSVSVTNTGEAWV